MKLNDRIATIILNDLDVTLTRGQLLELTAADLNEWGQKLTFPISTRKIGMMDLVIASLSVTVMVCVGSSNFRIEYKFAWDHPGGGSNGYRVTKDFERTFGDA